MNEKVVPMPPALTELMSIRDFVLDAQRMIKAGQMPDMTCIEQRTADLCRIIREASSDVQQQCAPELKELAYQLDDCEQELRSLFESLTAKQDTHQ